MPRIRTVKPEFFEDEIVGSFSRDSRLLFIATWTLADDEGLLRWSPEYLKATVFMYDPDLRESKISKLMQELEEAGVVFPYIGGRNNQRLAYIVNFRKHQRINRPQPGRLAPPSLQSNSALQMYGRRDLWTCHLCGERVPESNRDPAWNEKTNASLDHMIPRSLEGDNYPSNIRIAHSSCNKSRGNGAITKPRSWYVNGVITDSLNESVNDTKTQAQQEWKGKERSKERNGMDVGGSRRPDKDDPEFEALCEEQGVDWRQGLTKRGRDSLNAALADIRSAGDSSPDEIHKRASHLRDSFSTPFTAQALAKYWAALKHGPLRGGRRQVRDRAQEILEDAKAMKGVEDAGKRRDGPGGAAPVGLPGA